MARNDEKKSIRCSFCGKHQDQVSRIIAGPGAYICNECVALCNSILDDGEYEDHLTEEDIPEAALRAAIEPTGYKVLGYKEEPYQKKGLFGWLSK